MVQFSVQPTWATPQRFGAKGDGITDDTQACQRAIDSSPWVLWPPGVYRVSVRPEFYQDALKGHALRLTSRTGVRWIGAGAILRMADHVPPTGRTAVLQVLACRDSRFEGLEFDGSRAARGVSGLGGMSTVDVLGGSRLVFQNCGFSNSCMDGLHIAAISPSVLTTYPSRVVLDQCWAENSYRNGVSIISATDVQVLGGHYCNSNGTDPQAGIDSEPNLDDVGGVTGLRIAGTVFRGNRQFGLVLAGNFPTPGSFTRDAVVTDISGTGNGHGLLSIWAEDVQVRGLSVRGDTVPIAGPAYVLISRRARRVTVRDAAFSRITGAAASKGLILVDNYDDPEVNPHHSVVGVHAFGVACPPVRVADRFCVPRDVETDWSAP